MDQRAGVRDQGSQPRLSLAGGGVGGGKVSQDQGSTSSAELHSAQGSGLKDQGSQPRLSPAGGGIGGGKVSQVQGSSSAELHSAQGSGLKDQGSQPRLSPAGRGVGGGEVSQVQGSSSAELLPILPLEPAPQTDKLGQESSSVHSAEKSVPLFPSISQITNLPHESHELQYFIRSVAPTQVKASPSERFLRHHLGLQIGAVLSPGLGENLAEVNWITRPQIGLHYAYAIRPRWRIHTGLNYAQQGVEEVSKSFTSRAFGFGFASETQTLTPQSLHFVEVPVQLERRFGNRHFLQLGVQGAYLFQVSSQWASNSADSFQESQPTTETRWGYRQGFRPWQLRPTLGYRYYLGKGILLGIQGQAGLTEVLDGSFYQPTSPMRNLQLRATLTYDLWNF